MNSLIKYIFFSLFLISVLGCEVRGDNNEQSFKKINLTVENIEIIVPNSLKEEIDTSFPFIYRKQSSSNKHIPNVTLLKSKLSEYTSLKEYVKEELVFTLESNDIKLKAVKEYSYNDKEYFDIVFFNPKRGYYLMTIGRKDSHIYILSYLFENKNSKEYTEISGVLNRLNIK